MNFTKGLSTLMGRVRNLMRGETLPVKLNTVVERQLETAAVAESNRKLEGRAFTHGRTGHTSCLNLAVCRCEHKGLLPVWCKRHRCYVVEGNPDRPKTFRNGHGRKVAARGFWRPKTKKAGSQ